MLDNVIGSLKNWSQGHARRPKKGVLILQPYQKLYRHFHYQGLLARKLEGITNYPLKLKEVIIYGRILTKIFLTN